jgi:hypothetical protein
MIIKILSLPPASFLFLLGLLQRFSRSPQGSVMSLSVVAGWLLNLLGFLFHLPLFYPVVQNQMMMMMVVVVVVLLDLQ